MIVKLYRKLPVGFRVIIYNCFLGTILNYIRNPQALKYCFKEPQIKRKLIEFLPLFKNKNGLEVGGGSYIFSKEGNLPIYSVANRVDGCNYSYQTVWEGNLSQGTYKYKGVNLGPQFIGEATEIKMIVGKMYDFISSSKCVEHVANPLKAVKSWLNVLNAGGYILLILPNKISNFDHRRPDTSFSHLLEDYANDVNENDMTHFDEIIELHDPDKDVVGNNKDVFIGRSMKNDENRCFHHHIFTVKLLEKIFSYFNLEIIYSQEGWDNIYILGRKLK